MQSAGRLAYIDAMRGAAALLVVVQHAAQIAHEKGSALFDPMLETINLGRFGIVLFFLISGFVIPFSFRGGRPIRDFAIGRFFRLYPAYWLSLLAFVLMYSAMGVAIAPGTILANVTMLQGAVGIQNVGYGYWTLTVEMAFYAICAALCWRGKLDDAALIGVAIVACVGLAVSPYLMGAVTGNIGYEWGFPFFLALFLTGLMLRRAEVEGCAVARRWVPWLVPFMTVAALVLSGWFFPVGSNKVPFFGVAPLGYANAAAILVFVACVHWKPRAWRALLFLGTISYSVYLFQDLALYACVRLVDAGASGAGYVALVLAMTIAIAVLVYRLVERPMIALGRRVTGRKEGLPAVQAAP